MRSLWQDARYALRLMARNPGFSFVAVATLALGIGANTAIFSVVNAVLLRPLPYQESERLAILSEINPQHGPQQGRDPIGVSYPNFADWRDQNKSFEKLAAYGSGGLIFTGRDEPVRLQAALVSADLFPLLGVKPERGRTFLPEEDQVGGASAVVVSHGFWQRYFGGAESMIGQALVLNGKSYDVIGVMPAGFAFPVEGTEVWIALGPFAKTLHNRNVHTLTAIGRLRPDVPLSQAQRELAAITARVAEQHPAADPGHEAQVIGANESLTGKVRPALLVLLSAVGLLLAVACANVANLLLARAEARQKEIAVRLALGAGRGRIVRQLLSESLLLALIGGAAGLLLAVWGIEALTGSLPNDLPRAKEIGLDRTVLAFTAALSVLTGVFFGVIPALSATRPALYETLKEGGRAGAGVRRRRTRSALVVAEVAVAVALLIGAGLLIRSFQRVVDVDPGFKSDHLLTMNVTLLGEKYRQKESVIAFFRDLPERLGALPGVTAVSAVSNLPISGGDGHGSLTIDGRAIAPAETPEASFRRILPNYFGVMRIPLRQGREFDARDTGAEKVVIINESMARRYWPDGDAIGKRIKVGPPENEPWLTVVGVVGDVRNVGLETEALLATYEPHAQRPWDSMNLAIRAEADPLTLAAGVRSALREMDQGLLVRNLSTMDERIRTSLSPRRLNLMLLALFASLALLLAAVGVYGVVSYTVTERTHEIGVRMALGAQPRDVMKDIVGGGLKLAMGGAALGLGAAFILTRWMEGLLFGVQATDAWTYAAAAVLLVVVTMIACSLPARRATRIDPLQALRYE